MFVSCGASKRNIYYTNSGAHHNRLCLDSLETTDRNSWHGLSGQLWMGLLHSGSTRGMPRAKD